MTDFVIRGSWVGGLSQIPPSFTAATYAALMSGISTGQYQAPCFIFVSADETQGGIKNLYFYDGDAPAVVGSAAALPQVFATFSALQAAITAGQFTAPRFADVAADESFDGLNSLYFVVANDPGLPIIR